MYHLRLWLYEWEAKEIETNARLSFVDGTRKKWYTEPDSYIEGEIVNEEVENIYMIRMTREEAGNHVKDILRQIRKEKPTMYIDFTFSKYNSDRNEEIYSGVI
jgi:hypothetical protein